ncbi:MAG: hypothetical protein ACLRFE_04520 [Clostridia bacterium]
MEKRNYEMQDIYDYLLQYYDLEWKLFKVKNIDFDTNKVGVDETNFSIVTVVYSNNKRKTVRLSVSNDKFDVYEINPKKHYYGKPAFDWKRFLARQHDQLRNQGNAL